jgi:hypothetical protein
MSAIQRSPSSWLELNARKTAFNQVTKAHKPVAEQLRLPLYR